MRIILPLFILLCFTACSKPSGDKASGDDQQRENSKVPIPVIEDTQPKMDTQPEMEQITKFAYLGAHDMEQVQITGKVTAIPKKMPRPGAETEYTDMARLILEDGGRVHLGILEPEGILKDLMGKTATFQGMLIISRREITAGELSGNTAMPDIPEIEMLETNSEQKFQLQAELAGAKLVHVNK